MFDKTPTNLPTEPEDMLGSSDAPADTSPSAATSGIRAAVSGDGTDGEMPQAPRVMPQLVDLGPSALEAGKLKPAASSTALPQLPREEYEVKRSFLGSKTFAITIGIIVLVILVVGGVWIFAGKSPTKPIKPSATQVVPTTPAEVSLEAQLEGGVVPGEEAATVEGSAEAGETPAATPPGETPAGVATPAPEPENLDTDADGLTDSEEAQQGTLANNPDSDNDGLTDGAEVKIWKTDPLKADSDGDTYSDGAEVKNGYNPNGPGKLFETPKE